MAKKKTSFASIMRQVAKQTKKTAFKKSVQKAANKKKQSSNRNDVAQAAKAAAQAAQEAAKRAAAEKERKRQAAQKVAQASLKLTKMRNAQKKAAANQQKNKTWRDNLRADGKQAVAKAKKIDALGAKVKTKSYKTNTGMARGLAKVAGYSKAYGDAYKDLSNEKKHGKLTDSQKKQAIKEYVMPKAKAEVDKAVDKALPKTLKYRNLTSDEYLRLQNAERMPSVEAKNAALGKNLAKTVGSLNTAALKKGKFASGAMEGLNPLPVSLGRMGSGTYSNGEKVQNRKSKDSTAYKAGYMAGQVGSFFLGGGLGAGESGIAKGLLKNMGTKQASKALAKNGAKTGLKIAGKGTAKRLVRGQLDDASRAMISAAAKNASKTAGKSGTTATKRFVAGRVADAAVSSPLNASDAIKSATDENGNVHWGEAGKAFALNTGLDLLVGGGIDVGTKAVSKLTSKDLQKTVKILAKQKSGIELTPAETKFLQKAIAQAKNTVAERAGQRAVDELRAKQEKPFTALPEVKSVAETESTPKIQTQEVKSGGVNVKSAEPIAKSEEAGYNNINGGVENGKEVRQVGKRTVSADGSGKANIRQVDEGVPGRRGLDNSRADESAGTEGLGNARMGNKPIKIAPETRIKMTNNGIVDTKLSSSDYVVFSKALDTGKSQNKFGAFVDSQSVDDLTKNNAKTFLSDDGSVGIAVKADGDICGAFNSGKTYRGATKDLLVTARANGGTKMDCYGIKLVNKYEQAGFVPVAKVPFNAEYVDNALLLSKKPDVYVLMKNDDSIDEVIDKIGAKSYKESTQAELDALPTFSDYDEALAYRDNLLAEQESRVAEAKRATKANDEAIVRHIDSMRKNGFTDDDILDQLQKMGTSPQKAMDMVENTPVSKVQRETMAKIEKDPKAQENWMAESKAAYDNADKVVMAKTAGEQIKKENPPASDIMKDVRKVASDGEMGRNAKKTRKLFIEGNDELEAIFDEKAADGVFGKAKGYTQADAKEFVAREIDDDFMRCYKNFLDTDTLNGLPDKDAHVAFARARALSEELSKRFEAGDKAAAEQMMNVLEKANELASFSGRALNAAKLLVKTTPEGRVRMALKDIDRLNSRYSSRLKNGKLELTEDQVQRILNANDDEITDVMDEINREIWDKIPATLFEKFNEIRHLSMLGNLKTHERNLVGNYMFKAVRSLSDGMEVVMNKMAKSHIEKLGGEVDMVKVDRKIIKENKELLDKEFKEAYDNSGSINRYIESTRPEGVTAVEWKALRWMVNKNYNLLEKEDMLTFIPEFKKNYVRKCESKGWDIKNLTAEQKNEARNYALFKAEYATFRDTTQFSSWLTGLKQKTEGAKGKTRLGTAGYRLANAALESSVPFVKTPVNVFRRSVDFSPISLIRATTKLVKQEDPELFKQGLHDLATGLTGTGVFGLGMYLAESGAITVKAGNVSGDAYYDRDMGFQDYSLNIHFPNGKEYSWTIDWASPMQSSLFMGAQVWNEITADGWQPMAVWNCLTAMTGPMLDMSFMSGTKDTVENFIDQAYRQGNGEADWSGAAFQALFGSVPQGYLNGFVPQVSSQLAGALDSKMRDTRSTKENPVSKSWDSWRRKMINRVPGLRNKLLNPKVDRFGNDVENGNNVVTRLLQSFVNPSNVKEIKFTKMDKEIIAIYNHMEEGNDKKFFFYNFTGNPSYDLGNGKRMTYDEAYKFGKESRRQQASGIKDMIDAKSYKNMTWKMKSSEVNDAHWIGQTCADLKTYGAKFAANRIAKNEENDKEARRANKMLGGTDKEFVNFYIQKEKLIARSHASDYYIKAMAVALSGNDKMATAYGIHTDKVKAAKEYLNSGGNRKEFTNASCNIASGINKAGVSTSTANKAVSAASFNIKERTYRALGLSEQKANMGVGLKNFGYTFKSLTEHKFMSVYQCDEDGNGSLNKKELVKYIDSLGLSSKAEKACLFEYLKGSSAKNPYGRIPNYLSFDKLDKVSSGRGSRGGYGRSGRRSGRSGSSSTSTKKTNMPSWESYVKDALSNSGKVSAVNLKDWDSPIDSSFKSKTASIRKKTTARM